MREKRWYIFAFFLAAVLRFLHLGALPLNDPEALRALQALHGGIVGTDAAYILLTRGIFFLFHASNFWARFLPALVGTFLVLAPMAFRSQLGSRAAILFSFALALDPGLVAASRQADGAILAISFAVFALAFWEERRPRLAGVFAAFALLSGKVFWAGALAVFLAWLLSRGLAVPEEEENVEHFFRAPLIRYPRKDDLRRAGIAAGWTLLFGGTMLFLVPDGLNAAAGAIPSYLFGWVSSSGISPSYPLAAMLVYEGFALFFGVIGAARGWIQDNEASQALSLLAGTALFLALVYPSREMFHLLWVIVPLWALAAKEIVRYFRLPEDSRAETLSAAALTLVLIGFGWLNFASVSLLPQTSLANSTRFALILGAALLLALSLLLIGFGWSPQTALYGGFWGIFLALTLYTLGTAWGATGLRTPDGAELWTPYASPPEADLLLQTVNDLSDWSTGDAHAQPVTIAGVDSPSLQWLLRDHPLHLTDSVSPTEPPPLLITPVIDSPHLPASYRGQDFVWKKTPLWDQTSLAAWFLRRQTAAAPESILLWAREDLFLDSQLSQTP